MVNGRMTEVGSYNQLIAHNGPFAQFLKQYFLQEEESETEEEGEGMYNRHKFDVKYFTRLCKMAV